MKGYGKCVILSMILHLYKFRAIATKCYCTGDFCENTCDKGKCCETSSEVGTCFVRFLLNSTAAMVDYGCIHYLPVACVSSDAIDCCNTAPYCNRNLSIPYPPTMTSSIISTISSNYHSISSTSTTLSGNDTDTFIPIITTSIIVPAIILILLGIMATIIIYMVCKRRAKRLNRSNRNNSYFEKKELPSNGFPDSHSFTQIIDPIPATLSDITLSCTSGSGGGMPHLVERTVARGTLLGDMIGGGKFGQVYLGYYQGEKYAVKKFFSRDEHSWFREREIYNSFNMRHENILSYVAADILSNTGMTELWLITQFHPRGSLFDELHRDPLSVEQTIKYIFSACRGITYLHMDLPGTQGKPSIAHRDLKSKNMLVKNDDTLCIADFGLAVVYNSPKLSMPDNLRQGTKRYMAPELLEETVNGKNFESFIRTDIYSFGIVLWEICSRTNLKGNCQEYELPFEYIVPYDPSFEDMREAIVLKGITPELHDHWNENELFIGLGKVMSECWYRDPAARPTSFHIRKKLKRLIDNCSLKLDHNFTF